MPKWSDPILLVAAPGSVPQTNPNGFALPDAEQSRLVWGNRKAVGYSEFYAAQQAGKKAEIKVDLLCCEYRGEPFAEVDGHRYKVLRTYSTKNGEHIELTLSDLSEDKAPQPPQEGGGIKTGEDSTGQAKQGAEGQPAAQAEQEGGTEDGKD